MRITKRQLVETIRGALREGWEEQGKALSELPDSMQEMLKSNAYDSDEFAVRLLHLFDRELKARNLPNSFYSRSAPYPFWNFDRDSSTGYTITCMGDMHSSGDWGKPRPKVKVTLTRDLTDRQISNRIRAMLSHPYVESENRNRLAYVKGLTDYVTSTGKYD